MQGNTKIAILGSTSHIAKGLIYNLRNKNADEVFLFSRSLNRLEDFLVKIHCAHKFKGYEFKDFNSFRYDCVINCVGVGSPKQLKIIGKDILELTERFDNLALDYLKRYPETLYINFSSGAVFAGDFSFPVNDDTSIEWDSKNLKPEDYYGLAKYYAETRHRALKELKIVDLRIFGYFSRFIDLEEQYLLSQIITALKDSREFITDKRNIVRDYLHPDDLFSLIESCLRKRERMNTAFDAYSSKPTGKFEILEFFRDNFGLKFKIEKSLVNASATGFKENYYSQSRKAGQILNYLPQFSSHDCIRRETEAILNLAKVL